MSNQNPQDKLIDFALTELAKVLQDMKEGKEPQMSSSMQKLASELENNTKKSKMSETEVKDFAERLIKQISNLED